MTTITPPIDSPMVPEICVLPRSEGLDGDD
jgi:hypothetical protein